MFYCIYKQTAFKYIDFNKKIITINNQFNFLDYFNKEDLIKENIDITNYPDIIDLNNLKQQELSILKRILIFLKELRESVYDIDNIYEEIIVKKK